MWTKRSCIEVSKFSQLPLTLFWITPQTGAQKRQHSLEMLDGVCMGIRLITSIINISRGDEIVVNKDFVQNVVSVSIWVVPDELYRSVEHKFSVVLYLLSE